MLQMAAFRGWWGALSIAILLTAICAKTLAMRQAWARGTWIAAVPLVAEVLLVCLLLAGRCRLAGIGILLIGGVGIVWSVLIPMPCPCFGTIALERRLHFVLAALLVAAGCGLLRQAGRSHVATVHQGWDSAPLRR